MGQPPGALKVLQARLMHLSLFLHQQAPQLFQAQIFGGFSTGHREIIL
jgi:hypothetical protein